MSYMQARKKAAEAGKKSFKYTTKDGETRKYELVEGKKGAKIYKCVANCAEKRKKSKKKQRKDLARQAAKAARRRSSNRRKRSRRASKKAKDCAFGERYVNGKGCVMRKQSQLAGKFMPEFGGGDQCSTLLAGHYLSRIQNAIIALEARRDGLSLPAIKKYLKADESEYRLISAALRRGVECGFLQKHKGKWKIKKYLKM